MRFKQLWDITRFILRQYLTLALGQKEAKSFFTEFYFRWINLKNAKGRPPVVVTYDGRTTIYGRTNRNLESLRKEKCLPEDLLNPQFLVGKTVLDIGSGGGAFVSELRVHGVEAFGVDLCLDPEQKAPYFHEAPSWQLPFQDSTFDLIYSFASVFLYEIDEPPLVRKTLEEMERVLKPGGKIRLSWIDPVKLKKELHHHPQLTITRERGEDWDGHDHFEIEKLAFSR